MSDKKIICENTAVTAEQKEAAYQIGEVYFSIQESEEGYDYSFFDKNYRLIDGGIYDDPECSMEEVSYILLKEEGLSDVERISVDYDDLLEKADEAETRFLEEQGIRARKIPVLSEDNTPECGLCGRSRSEIEEIVWVIAMAEIIQNDLDVQVKAVRVYGSRTREGLYREDSNLDVVISYEGSIQADDLRTTLNEEGYRIEDMLLDINPIRDDKTGTLQAFFARSEQYLDQKERKMGEKKMTKEDVLKILISMMLDMDYADYLEFAEEDLNRCLSDLKFLEDNGRQDLLLLLRSLADNHMELLKWYHEHIQTK